MTVVRAFHIALAAGLLAIAGHLAAAEPLKVAYSDWPGWVAWDVAIQKGWIKDAGLDVQFVWMEYGPSMEAPKKLEWRIVSAASGALAALATRRLLLLGWSRLAPGDPPDNPEDPSTSLQEALTWAIATGVGLGVARILAVRTAAKVWEAAAHEPPPAF